MSEEEFDVGIDFLNRIGKSTHDAHNEGILFSGRDWIFDPRLPAQQRKAWGYPKLAAALLGPFWRMNSPATANGGFQS